MVHSIDPDQPVVNPRTLEQVQAEWIAPFRLTAILVGIFRGVRPGHCGPRCGLEILGLVVRRALPLLAAGLVLGGVVSFWLTRFLANLLFGVVRNDPLTYLAVAAVFAAVFILSALVPARRAVRIEPTLAL